MRFTLFVIVSLALTRAADAYPQYQLSRDQTCTSCHLSPAGGGLLDENGLATAEATTTSKDSAEFLHGKLEAPSWLVLGGDARIAAGAVDNGAMNGAAYPMQAEVHASAGAKGFSVALTGGLRRPADGGSAAHVVWSREHYAMWRQHPDAPAHVELLVTTRLELLDAGSGPNGGYLLAQLHYRL